MVASGLTTSIRLTWEQPEGSADAVDSYAINYMYFVDECSGEGGNFPPVTVMLGNGSQRSYILTNSSLTPVEEDSIYFITLTAANSVTQSIPSNTGANTDNAGI